MHHEERFMLTQVQQRAIELLAQGRSIALVASEIDRTRQMIYRWKKEAEFKAELAKAQKAACHDLSEIAQNPVEMLAKITAAAYRSLLNRVETDGRVALDFLRERGELKPRENTDSATRLRVTFGTIPNDAPPLPANIVQLPKQEQA